MDSKKNQLIYYLKKNKQKYNTITIYMKILGNLLKVNVHNLIVSIINLWLDSKS